MSDGISLSYGEREVPKLVSGNTNYTEPTHPYQLQWMAHWTQGSSSTYLQASKHCVGTNATIYQTGRCCLPVETMKRSYSYERKNSWKCKQDKQYERKNSWKCKQDKQSYILQSVEAQDDDNGKFRVMNNSVLKRNHSSSSETFKRLHKHKSPASSVIWKRISSYHFQNSNSLRSELSHFPTFDINMKLETLMAQKKKTMSPNTKLAPHLTELASEGHHHPEQNMAQTDDDIMPYESLGGLPYHNCHRPSMTSIMDNDEENDHFGSGLAFKEHFAHANLSHLKHELCNYSKQPTIMVSEMKSDDLRCVESSRDRLHDRSRSCPENVPSQLPPSECNKERENICDRNRTRLGVSRLNKMSCSSMRKRKGERRKCSSGTQHMLIRKEVGTDMCHKNRTVGDSIASANKRGTTLFEKLTVPTMPYFHGHLEESSQTLLSPTNNTEDVCGIDTQLMMKENVPLVKSDTMHIDVHETPSCPEVGISAQPQKDAVHPNLKSSEIADTDSSTPESMDAVLNRIATHPPGNTPDSEPSWKWVKRLRPNPLDPTPLNSKRVKMGDTSTGEMQNLLAIAVNRDRYISDLPDVPKNGERSPGDSATLIHWIRRWCRSGQDTASPTLVLCEPEHSKLPSEKFEAAQFPSLAAMALMGKLVTNFRPCEFRRSGSTVVWKI